MRVRLEDEHNVISDWKYVGWSGGEGTLTAYQYWNTLYLYQQLTTISEPTTMSATSSPLQSEPVEFTCHTPDSEPEPAKSPATS